MQMDHDGISDLPQFSVTGFKVFDAINMSRESITSVLTMVLIAKDSKTDSPKVDYPTALDVYIWICYITLFVCMVEFTVVHYFTKFNTGDPEIQAIEREKIRQIIRSIPKTAVMSSRRHNELRIMTRKQNTAFSRRDGGRHSMYHRVKRLSVNSERRMLTPQRSTIEEEGHGQSMEEFQRDSVGWRLYYWMMDHHDKKADPLGLAQNSISIVDRFARIILPIAFIGVVFLYYHFYVNTPMRYF
uniref:Neur_chan_memb domain-containing protein n=1 Tax=Heterorhabditis bacteriophora TaxID=37862 RepID=A0A1I7XFD5_HETBA